MNPWEVLAWTILLIGSILTVAALLAALRQRRVFQLRKSDTSYACADKCLARLQQLAHASPSKDPEQLRAELKGISRAVRPYREREALVAVLAYLLENVPHHLADRDTLAAGLRNVMSIWQRRMERGGLRLCGYLIKLGPWAGLAGTLVGVRASLGLFVGNITAVNKFVSGFATAIDTTIWGVAIAIVALTTIKAIWVPLLERQHAEVTEYAVAALMSLNRIYRDIGGDGSAQRQNQSGPPLPQGPLLTVIPLTSLDV
jgi:biopolymer transport protein ExbB/TolQ